MPQVEAAGLRINYEVEGEGEPAHGALQLHLGGPAGLGRERQAGRPPLHVTYADQVAEFMAAAGIEQAHVAGVSLGAAIATHLAARHPERVRSLSLHSGWDRTDAYPG